MRSQIFEIVFEDDTCVVVHKRQPFLSQPGDDGRGEGLYSLVGRALGCELIPVHRLDREVLGLIIFAKTESAAKSLSKQFRDRSVGKAYWAKVLGIPKEEKATLVHYLLKDPKKNYVTVFPRETPGAKYAELDYELIREDVKSSELRIDLKTGRSHQIRAQLAKVGHPILGDARYGKKFRTQMEFYEGPIQLRSVWLRVRHPKTGEVMEWSIDS